MMAETEQSRRPRPRGPRDALDLAVAGLRDCIVAADCAGAGRNEIALAAASLHGAIGDIAGGLQLAEVPARDAGGLTGAR